jgi:hypothetical protein
VIEPRTGDQRTEVPPSLAILYETDEMGAESRDLILPHHTPRQRVTHRWRKPRGQWHIDGEFGAEDPWESCFSCGGREAHCPTDIIVIGEGKGRESEGVCPRDECLRRARAIEE